jgi:ABC-2 type transport system ATP-binding protein
MLSEVEQTVDDVVIIANGRFVRQGSMASLHGEQTSVVATSDAVALAGALDRAGLPATVTDAHHLTAAGGDLARIGDVALQAGLPIHELRAHQTDLEELFFALTDAPENRNRNLEGGSAPDQPSAAHEGAML